MLIAAIIKMRSIAVTLPSWLSVIAGVLNRGRRAMTFELVKAGWPNTVAVVALAAMPMLALLQPTQPAPQVSIVETADPPDSTLIVAGRDVD